MTATSFEKEYGFPRDSVRLDNWRNAPWNVWAFRHISELIPTARIPASSPGTEEKIDPTALISEKVTIAGESLAIRDILTQTWTDALVVMKSGRFAADYHAANFTMQSRHIMFSSSKSVTGVLAGILKGEGLLDPQAPVSHYVPELTASAFGDATVRHVLDMRTSLSFTEDYGDPRGEFARYRRAGLLDPQLPGEKQETLIEFLASLKKGTGAHGGPFHYCSPNSDVLGLVVERAAGERFAALSASRLWQPLELRADGIVTVDIEGSARAGGGLSMTPRDLARIGEMMRTGGRTGERLVVPADWVADTIHGGDAAAWRNGSFAEWLPSGSYRNQWYQTGNASRAFFALGIHGQWLYVDPAAEMVIVKFSSQPFPIKNEAKSLHLALFEIISGLL